MNTRSLQKIVLAIAQAQEVDAVLQLIVRGLAEEIDVALARIWLIAPGDLCASCHMKAICPDQRRCLHLAASAGNTISDEVLPALEGRAWTSIDGYFRRIPLNAPLKVGHVGGTGHGVLLQIDESGENHHWIEHPEWAESEKILSFAGQPLISKERVLGVLAVFSRQRLVDNEFEWLRTFADHAAVAIVNARALEARERAEKALRESERRIHAFWDNGPNLVFIKDLAGRYLYANERFERALAVDRERLKGKTDEEVFSSEQAASFRSNDLAVLRAGTLMEFEEVALQSDGPHTSIVHKFPLLNEKGEIYAIGGIVTDITERKKEESARRYSEERYRVVVETANDAVVSTDESGAILFANPAIKRVFGYDPTELLGKPLTVLMPEFMRKLHEDGFKRYLATGQRHINWQGTELIGLRKNGQEFPVEVSFGELTGERRLFTGFIRDISERKQAEEGRERLRQAQADLAHINRVSTMGELTVSLAHEINQPIGAAVTNAQACLRFLNRGQPDVPEAREAALQMVKDAARAADIIDRVRSLYRKSTPRQEMVDVNEVIREMVVMLHKEANRNSVRIRAEICESLPHAVADRVQLQQVLMNLMMNGIEAMRDAGGELSVKSQLAEDGQLLISVSDTGVGLPTGKDAEIFKPFFTTKSQGTGLGLAITRSIIESHSGHVWATSNSGRGATFQFTLPRKKAARA